MYRLIERVHERQAKWQTVRVATLPLPQELTETAILGAYSYAFSGSRTRLIRSDMVISVNGTGDVPPALARDYLTITRGKAAPIKWAQLKRINETARPYPIYALPQTFEDGAYIDVRAAFWSIMQVCGWATDYYPGRWLARGLGVRDFPFLDDTHPQKVARNSLVTAGIVRPMQLWDAGRREPIEIPAANPLVNGQLVGLVHDVLHAIAWAARAAGAIYIATDGYIAPTRAIADRIVQAVADWGLVARVKADGRGWVAGAGNYRVGPVRSKVRRRQQTVDNMQAGEWDGWLRARFAKLAALADRPD